MKQLLEIIGDIIGALAVFVVPCIIYFMLWAMQ